MRRTAIALIGLSMMCLVIGGRAQEKRTYAFDPSVSAKNVRFSGVRSSIYGIEPFPVPEGWKTAISAMNAYFPGSTPCAIWIVGRIKKPKTCALEFPSDGKQHENIEFLDYDKHESYLDHFDQAGIKVFLQVEPAQADVVTLIDLVLNKYKRHESVIGFGVDVEWLREFENPGWGVRVDDNLAKLWESRIKDHNKDYRLFLKHWDRNWMPPTHRGDIVFVDDSQSLEDFQAMVDEFVSYWADYFKPNTVFFQIGYPSDKIWWEKLENPAKTIGLAVAQNVEQECGIFWVDFTLRDVLPISSEKKNSKQQQ